MKQFLFYKGFKPRGGGGGGTPLYKAIYVCVQCHRVWFLIRFGLKRGIDLHHFGLK